MLDNYFYNLWASALHRSRKNFTLKKLENYGAISGYPMLILTIDRNIGSSQEQLSNLLKIDKAAITRAIKKLETEEYVRREPDTFDKRAFKVYLTPKAQALVPEIENALCEWGKFAFSGISEEMLSVLQKCLKSMSENTINIDYNNNNCKNTITS